MMPAIIRAASPTAHSNADILSLAQNQPAAATVCCSPHSLQIYGLDFMAAKGDSVAAKDDSVAAKDDTVPAKGASVPAKGDSVAARGAFNTLRRPHWSL